MTESESTEPVSWLRLEQYHLGELPPEEAREVERAIQTDARTRECFEIVQRPVRLNPRPDLPTRAEERPLTDPFTARRRLRDALGSSWPTLVLATAAAFVAYVTTRPADQPDGMPGARYHLKGGDVAIEVVRERRGVVTRNPESFADGDRFKVVLTCPPSMTETFEILVIQGQDVSRPLAPLGAVACGNGVALPGAFTLTGQDTSVCVAWGAAAGAEGHVEKGGLPRLHGSAVCRTLKPER